LNIKGWYQEEEGVSCLYWCWCYWREDLY
jgi:hypothetical protein